MVNTTLHLIMTQFLLLEEEEDIGTSAVYIAVAYLQLNDIYIHVHVQGSLVLCIETDNCTCLKCMYMKNTVTGPDKPGIV